MSSNKEVIRSFIHAWSRLDANELADFFSDDGTYHNMPSKPVVGKRNIKLFIEKFIANWNSTSWDILTIVEDGDTVICERLDITRTSTGDVHLPCCGVFEMQDGKIHIWRDYFDLNTYMKGITP
ncbi:limonene-1,2-epoxide hydrolase family protein [Pseudohongiella spirulinae]|uniref:Limonene-1,2-epoxide hydrolase n=1 Tax=Pseudohongiella spirulinae TaxID=1249552 RepID=A0A0S2KGS7_9GAMM|nr:limonene-1,2-epoxide hydrolase family protein [Pseudohongiella spirulinae]ALO47536.1 limonene-1,2-epoxide hydrolase [Pseudohongiella spirulinae]